MRLKNRLEKLESSQTEKGLADQLAEARLKNTRRPLPTKSELEAIATRNPESLAARLARGALRVGAYVDE